MKKALFIVALVATAFCAKAQVNIQEQYDFNREHLTTTLEMFKMDDWGSTFFFTDIYHPDKFSAPTDYYTEIARSLNFWQNTKLGGLSAHVEWNGGIGYRTNKKEESYYTVSNAWLFGAEYFLHSSDFRYTLTFEVLYKNISGKWRLDNMSEEARPYDQISDVPLQFTIIWGCNNIFGLKGLNFSGFADFWWENNTWGHKDNGDWDITHVVFISEPQLWYNIGNLFGCPNLFIGGEVELTYNFVGGWKAGKIIDGEFVNQNKGFTAAPAAGLKWNF